MERSQFQKKKVSIINMIKRSFVIYLLSSWSFFKREVLQIQVACSLSQVAHITGLSVQLILCFVLASAGVCCSCVDTVCALPGSIIVG